MNKQRWLTLVVLAVLLVASSPKPALSSFTPVMEPEVRPITDRHMGLNDVVSDEWLAHMRADLASATPDWWDGSTQADARYGSSIASAGDFNGDGYDDLIVGAWYYPTSSVVRSGRAWLYYGSASGLSWAPDLIFDPPLLKANGFFGYSVGTAGDVNDDNVDDIIIGMVNWTGPYSDEGAAFVYYGSDTTTPATTPAWYAHANLLYASMGSSVSTAGDVNGDGVDDIIVGAYRYSNNSGAAFVWHGSSSGPNLGVTGTPANAAWKVISTQGNYEMTTTSTAGDVNGDGIDDIIIGAPYYDKPQTDEGLVMVWHGSFPNGLNLGVDGTMSNAVWTAEGDAINRRLGVSIGTVGDVNGDTYDDVILGSLLSAVDPGDALVFYGSSGGLTPTNATPADADWKVEDTVGGDARTFSVQSNPGADVNGDGYDDAIIGINGYDVISGTVTLTNTGAVAVWYGSASGLGGDETVASADWLAEGSQTGEYMGRYVNTAGDVDNNGAADVAAGAPYYDVSPSTPYPDDYYGRAYAYYFKPIPNITSLSPASATAGGSAFTLAVNGTNFVGTSTVLFHGSSRATTYGSSTLLTASISTADIATAGTAGVTVLNSAPGGGISNTDTFTINNPLPTITSLSPASATAGGSAFTLTVNGTGFANGSIVRWNDSDRATTFGSSTQLTASISAADIATGGTASVTVRNSAPGGGTSSAMTFTINNPLPNITSLSPASATAGGPAFTLTVNGTGFANGSIVRWNDSDRATTFGSSTQLTASINATDIATGGTAGVTVLNSAPGGGTSNAMTFTIDSHVYIYLPLVLKNFP